MAIAVIPEEPRGRSERLAVVLAIIVLLLIVGLFVFSMLDAYAF